MSDMSPSCRFAAERLTHLRRKIGLLALALVCAVPIDAGARESKHWIVLENCRFILNPADDGDSFHVSVGTKEYIFRLYMVDAPETDALTPGRLVEQAKYFGITVPQAIEVGEAAKEFTRQKLSEPFTVFTRMSDAMGHSRIERFYAFVQTKEGDLGEQLVRNGLARNYGFKGAPPGFKNSHVEVQKLQQLENEAREEKIGGWGIAAGGLNARPQRATAFSYFVPGANARPGTTPRESSIPRVSATSVPITPRADGDQKSARKEKTPRGKIDINTATEKELTTVPGIGHVMAARIMAARPFRGADDLRRVSGIGDKKYAQVRPYFQ